MREFKQKGVGPGGEAGRRPRSNSRLEDSVTRILNHAAQILEDRGVEGFNTNEISKRSGVPIGAIYHHFENKEAIVRELCARWLGRVTNRYDEFEKLNATEFDNMTFWLALLKRLHCAYKETIGLGAITRATEIWPNVHELEVRYDGLVVARVTRYLSMLGVDVGQREKRRIALLILNMMHYCLLLTAAANAREANANLADLAVSLGELTLRYRRASLPRIEKT